MITINKIKLMLDIAGERGVTGPEMMHIVGIVKYTMFWTPELLHLERIGSIYSEWEPGTFPRSRRYWKVSK